MTWFYSLIEISAKSQGHLQGLDEIHVFIHFVVTKMFRL